MRWFVRWRRGDPHGKKTLGGRTVDAPSKEAAIAIVEKELPDVTVYSAKFGNP